MTSALAPPSPVKKEDIFANAEIPKGLNLVEEIDKMRKEKNAIILAHYYQTGDIQDVSDFLGDSLQLARAAEKTDADMIVFCGVHFMAETAKILNPTKKVILPDLDAGCSLADSCKADELQALKDKHLGSIVVSYINCDSHVKGVSDIIVTSSNAEAIIRSLPKEQVIIFAPDKNLGRYLNSITGRNMILWDGSCVVHEAFSLERTGQLMMKHPNALLIAHPESEEPILKISDVVGSTARLLDFVQESPNKEFIVATEEGILHEMQKKAPNKILYPAPSTTLNKCNCSECAFMKMNTMEKLYICMKYEKPEIIMDEGVRQKALRSINRMLEMSKHIK